MLYSTYIYEDRDRVPALAVRVDGVVYEMRSALQAASALRQLARRWKAKLELADRRTEEYDPRFQTFILTDRDDWVPVDHVIWCGADGRDVKLEFSGGVGYINEGCKPFRREPRTAQAWRMLASAILRHP